MRAGRLVVDTGIHALGWSRQQAIDYFVGNSPLSLQSIEDEVEKVTALPSDAFVQNDWDVAMQMGLEIIGLMTIIGGALAVLLTGFAIYSHTVRKERELAVMKALGVGLGAFALNEGEVARHDEGRDLMHLAAAIHRGGLQEAPRILFAETVLIHEGALGPIDHLAGLESLGQVPDLGVERHHLLVPPDREFERRDEVALLERLDEVADRTSLARLLDEFALGERSEDEDGSQPVARDLAREIGRAHV